jgi:hypothetical protein
LTKLNKYEIIELPERRKKKMIKFSNSIYVREHEKQPRGFGKWAFFVRINDTKLNELECPFQHYPYNNHAFSVIWASDVMSLTDAKKEIKTWFETKGITKLDAYVAD